MTLLADVDWVSRLKPALFFLAGVCIPLLATFIKLEGVNKYRDRRRCPPSSQKLLRPPGYSLSQKLDDYFGRFLSHFLITGGWWGITLMLLPVGLEAVRSFLVHPLGVGFLTLIPVAFGVGTWLIIRLVRTLNAVRQVRWGLWGEQMVGEVLGQAAEVGYRAFHDLPGEGKWNVDHVCVGPRGVFVIETKTRSKPRDRGGKVQARVTQEGDRLHFPHWEDRQTIPQAQRNARWVAEYLTRKTGEKVTVETLVVIPGWYVEKTTSATPVRVMNEKYLQGYLRDQALRLDPAQVRRIVAALDEKCRTVEF